ncbi:hypothetical protein CKO25_07875 [Thiocapsa imhoffii]|uniref:Adenosylcobinamide amidohydrolase n=2 Tax=Thiocapsa imhoffii TaxID=382777 RepID=A0A9X1B8A8_9GAMM|nr:hypothetical protein [Thiocapsa imhoffii]
MVLDETDHDRLRREGRCLFIVFKRPHRVLSTCRVNGGLCETLTHLANHQGCEGVAHQVHALDAGTHGRVAAHGRACAEAGLPPESTALMSTAANMQCAALARLSAEELHVRVAATAGVLGNATRAGDPAGWHEEAETSRPVTNRPRSELGSDLGSGPGSDPESSLTPDHRGCGTIVTLVSINQPCTPACLVRAATMVTEAKSTAVLDLRIPSRQGVGLATGTGTDQLAIAAPLPRPGEWERQWAGGHNSLGELLARATHAAVTRALLLQNGLCAELRRNLCAALGRFGCDESLLETCARRTLDDAGAELFVANLVALIHDPRGAAAAYALAEVLELVRVGVLHREIAGEAVLDQAALLAAAIATKPERYALLRDQLMPDLHRPAGEFAALAVVRGFACKWS